MHSARPLEPLHREGAASVIAARLRAAITDGTLPAGSQLREVHLAATLGVSRGPVREALQRLIQEGLVRSALNRGVFVTSLFDDDIDDLYRARSALELAAAAAIAESDRTKTLVGVERALERLVRAERARWSEVAELDLGFHEALVAASGSERLTRMFATLAVETRLCLLALEPSYTQPRQLMNEHKGILAAIRSGDQARVNQAITAHMREAVERLTSRPSETPRATARRTSADPRAAAVSRGRPRGPIRRS